MITITRILSIILLGINIAIAQNFLHQYHQQEYPNYFEDPELHDVLHFNPSRLRSYEMVGIPSVRPTLRHYAINDSFEAGVPPFRPPTHYGARENPINVLDYLLYRQHVVSVKYSNKVILIIGRKALHIDNIIIHVRLILDNNISTL